MPSDKSSQQPTSAGSRVNNRRPSSRDTGSKAKSNGWWIVLSIALSMAGLIWWMTLPFQNAGTRMADKDQVSESSPLDLRGQELKRVESLELREIAIEDHKDFLRRRRERREKMFPKNVPGAKEAKKSWETKVESVQSELQQIEKQLAGRDAPEGSLLFERREYLKKSLEDGPQ